MILGALLWLLLLRVGLMDTPGRVSDSRVTICPGAGSKPQREIPVNSHLSSGVQRSQALIRTSGAQAPVPSSRRHNQENSRT